MASVFPTSKEGFYGYLSMVIPYLILEAVRLKISAANLALLNTLYGTASTPGTYLNYYALWSDTAGGRTKMVIVNLETFETNLQKLLMDIYNDIPASVWTDDDRVKLNRKTGLQIIRTKPTTPITEVCFVEYKILGGGDVKFAFRYIPDSTRASKPRSANALEIAGRIDKSFYKPTDGAGNDLASKIKYLPIANTEDGTTKAIKTKASFTEHFGTENSGNYLQFYARWIHTKYPGLEGPWTGPFVLMIS